MRRTTTAAFKDRIAEIRAMPNGKLKDEAKKELDEFMYMYRAAYELCYPESCLTEIVNARNVNHASQIMAHYRMKGA